MKVLILGAGMSGLCMAIALRRARIPFLVLEKSPRLGGTWWENTYPGCACDIPSHLYGYSFAPEPGWSRVYPGQAEILAYLERCARDHDLTRSIRFGVTATAARYDEARRRWRVEAADGARFEADVLVSALGPLHVPRYPDVEGLERFAGAAFHSARWDPTCALAGKRVAVIGNAASAVQLLPTVAAQAARVTVFQRSAHWVLPKPDRAYPAWLRRTYRTFPPLLRLVRWLQYLRQEAGFLLVFRRGGLLGGVLRRVIARRIRGEVPDPALQAALVPDYPPGCKRILLSNDYYRTLARDDVELVTDPLRAVRPEGLVTDRAVYDVDVLIYATGFQPLARSGLEVHGRGATSLAERWGALPRAHLGMTVPGFPNYFLLLGPNTGLGHNSVMWMVECQVRYVMRCLDALRRGGRRELEVTEAALEASARALERGLERGVWSDCRSWYQNEAGGVYAIWPHSTARYWWETRRPALERDFRLA